MFSGDLVGFYNLFISILTVLLRYFMEKIKSFFIVPGVGVTLAVYLKFTPGS